MVSTWMRWIAGASFVCCGCLSNGSNRPAPVGPVVNPTQSKVSSGTGTPPNGRAPLNTFGTAMPNSTPGSNPAPLGSTATAMPSSMPGSPPPVWPTPPPSPNASNPSVRVSTPYSPTNVPPTPGQNFQGGLAPIGN